MRCRNTRQNHRVAGRWCEMRRTRFAKGFQVGRKVGMNKLEEAYAGLLAGRKLAGEIEDYWFESITLKLADGVRYTPDFLVMMPDGELQLHEVKAGMAVKKDGVATGETKAMSEDASRVKIRVAAAKFPFRFILAYARKGQWFFDEVGE